MLKLSLEETIAAHREMWNWLAKNPAATKKEYPPFQKLARKGLYSEIPHQRCYLCEFAAQKNKGVADGEHCKYCPLDWKMPENTAYMCGFSLYGKWIYNYPKGQDFRKQIAKQIANLPLRQEKHL